MRNSSKVKTRGLQHFQPGRNSQCSAQAVIMTSSEGMVGVADTFLSFMELRRTRMIDAWLSLISVDFAAAFVNTFHSHSGWLERER